MILEVLLMHCMRLQTLATEQFGKAVANIVVIGIDLDARRLDKVEGAE